MDFSLASDPLFSTIITFCTLILLYLPTLFFRVIFSPVLISTSVLLLSLLRYGAVQRSTQEVLKERQIEKDSKIAESISSTKEFEIIHDLIIDEPKCVSSNSSEEIRVNNSENAVVDLDSTWQSAHDLIIDDYKWVSDFNEGSECEIISAPIPSQKLFYSDSFVEWNLRAPLEVIYEEYEGEEEEEQDDEQNEGFSEEKREAQMAIIERYTSLSKFYPDTDSDNSSEEDFLGIRDWDSPEHINLQWEKEEKEGLIEIELGQKRYSESEVEEDNLIEIDLFPASFTSR